MTASMPTFPEFYRAINRRDPFPWQARLAELVATTERWPEEIGVPTGLGKTACLEIAVWWLAGQADRASAERTAPTRIWWVVNRRLLVDSTTTKAREIAGLLNGCGSMTGANPDEALVEVARRLRSLSADPSASPLEVISLRGGIAPRTPSDPSRPTVILCTLPMYGSRLLFRGYGSSLRAVDAAMAGTDSLVLVDEAHLAPHLKSLMHALTDCVPGAEPPLNHQRSTATVVALTATGNPDSEQRFDLDDDDERHTEVRERLDATKPLELRIEKSGEMARHLADATVGVLRRASAPASFLVFANTPKTAREVFDHLQKDTAKKVPAPDLLLLTGLTREREADGIRDQILDPEHGMAAAWSGAIRRRHLIVVATQTLEVGADIDAEYLVTEACGVRALTQRLGRLNRLGRHGHARAVYVHMPPTKPRGGAGKERDFWPVYGEEPAVVLKRLEDAGRKTGGTVNLSPRRVIEVLGPPGEDNGRAPEVLPGILWEWIKTTTPPEGEAPVEPYFNGIESPRRTVSVIWRAHVPATGKRLWPRAKDREAVDIPMTEFRDALGDEDTHRLGDDGVTVEEISSTDLRPGDRIVLPTDRGLLDKFGWNASASDIVVDVSLAEQGLPLEPTAIRRLCGINLASLVETALGNDVDEIDETEQARAVAGILEAIQSVETPQGWNAADWSEFANSLEPQVVEARKEVPRLKVNNPTREARVGEFDETSLGAAATLDGHGYAVAKWARAVAEQVGIAVSLCELVEFAASLHDIGKADRRFQLWLDPEGKGGVPMAKSNAPRHRWESMRVAAGWPRGGRHEDLSARLLCAWLKEQPDWGTCLERELLVHLVISHHGKGRPLVVPVRDGTHESVHGVVSGIPVEVSADLAEVDWSQPARFRRLNNHFGPWGLALLEAIVIRSDHAVSSKGDTDLETR